jgi:hypothetical protein
LLDPHDFLADEELEPGGCLLLDCAALEQADADRQLFQRQALDLIDADEIANATGSTGQG